MNDLPEIGSFLSPRWNITRSGNHYITTQMVYDNAQPPKDCVAHLVHICEFTFVKIAKCHVSTYAITSKILSIVHLNSTASLLSYPPLPLGCLHPPNIILTLTQFPKNSTPVSELPLSLPRNYQFLP